MHGSVRHLRGWAPTPVDVDERESSDGGSSFGAVFLSRVGQVVQELSVREERPEADAEAAPGLHLNSLGVRRLLWALDAQTGDIDMSAMMTGYARVSAVLPAGDQGPRCLVASPLDVRVFQG
ncbi:SAVMC3_10250 family protein [Streptomyces sp. NPDC056144]|uniref:SAVMC3_10250 family protein n=1 Tax=unclassified Streptomyces TaxID=2593676 RepID=UPI0035D5CC99